MIEQRLLQTGAILRGHFRLSSGLHSDSYFQCARLVSHPQHAEYVGRSLAEKVRKQGLLPIDVVIGPALGGIVVAHEVARALGVCALFAERQSGTLCLRRGFAIDPGQRVLVVEDVITTGGSAKETADLVSSQGGIVVGYASIVDRGECHDLSPLVSLLQIHPQVFSEADCVLCKQGIPIQKPGSRPVAA